MEYDYLGAVEDDVKEYIKDEVNFMKQWKN